MRRSRCAAALLVALAALAGCGGDDAGETSAPSVTAQVGRQEVPVRPTQYCLAGEGQRYPSSPPVLEVPMDTPITLRVPEAVASDGWSVQVFDDELQELIGEVDVDPDTPVFDGINSSDIAPDAFYLVVVQRADPEACDGLSGAWPVGFIRSGAGGAAPPTATSTPPG
ncbi:DUF2771 family protein [Modestobacter lapidis]